MGKKAKKKGKSDKGLSIPKEIGGVKLSKELRHAGAQFVKLAQDPVAREVALAALAAALAARKDARKGGKALAQKAGDAVEDAGQNTAWLGTALAAAAAEAGRTLLDAYTGNAAARKPGDGRARAREKPTKRSKAEGAAGGTAH